MAGRTFGNPSAVALELHGCQVIVGNNRPAVWPDRPLSMGTAVAGLAEDPPVSLAQAVKNLSAIRGLV